MKRIIVLSVAVLAVGAAVGGYFLSQRQVERSAHPLEAIPDNVNLLIECPDPLAANEAIFNAPYAELLQSSVQIGGLLRHLALLDSLFGDHAVFHGSAVFHAVTSDSGMQVLTAFSPNQEMHTEDLMAWLEKTLIGHPLSKRISGDRTLFVEGDKGLSVTAAKGLVLVATNPTKVLQAINTLNDQASLYNDARLRTARASAGKNVQMNLYARISPDLISDNSLWNGQGEWAALDVSTRDEGPVMNGFTYVTDSLTSPLAKLLGQNPQPLDFQRYFPARVSSFLMFGVDDINTLKNEEGSAALTALDEKAGVKVKDYLFPWIGNQFGVCGLPSSTESEQHYALFRTSSTELADRLLHELAEHVGSDSFDIRHIPLPGLLHAVFGSPFPNTPSTYFTRYEDLVIFADSPEALETYIHHLKADRTLATDPAFARFMEQFSSSFNAFSFQRLPIAGAGLRSRMNTKGKAMFDDLNRLFGQLPNFGMQFSSTGDALYTNMHWQYDPDWDSRSLTDATAKMDAPVQGRPIWVVNHLSKEPEILVQDKNNILYLFNRDGQELFRRELTEPMVGNAVQVDRYKNGNLQYVFGTNNFIYQIDRNGKDVEGFPVELESPVNQPLQVVDYEDKRNYRLLVSSKNKRVYNYSIEGKSVNGWRFDRTENPTATPFAYLSHKGRDYLSLGEKDGTVHLLNRAGGVRSKVKENIPYSKEARMWPIVSKTAEHVGFYVTDKEGTVYHVGIKGDTRLHNLGRFTEDHHFIAADLSGNGKPEFVFSDLNMLKVFDGAKKLLFEHRLAPKAIGPFVIGLKGGKHGLGYAFPDEEHILLIDGNGSTEDGFPLEGSSAFDLVTLPSGESLVVVGSHKGLTIHTLD